MVEYRLDLVFAALGNDTRRQLLEHLRDAGDCTVTALAEPLRISLNGVSKHLKVLEDAGLVVRTVTGRVHHIRLEAGALAAAHEWTRTYEKFWNRRLDAMELLIQKRKQKEWTEWKLRDDEK